MKPGAAVGITLGLLVWGPGTPVALDTPEDLDAHLHKDARIELGLTPVVATGEDAALGGHLVIPPRVAAAFAVHHLRRMGVSGVVICEVRWIAAATSGYLVDALGSQTIDGRSFSVFRIGIRDGAERQHGIELEAGTPFVFIALGWDAAARPFWHPPPGPDARFSPEQVTPEGALAFEYLLGREGFETLPLRYPLPARLRAPTDS